MNDQLKHTDDNCESESHNEKDRKLFWIMFRLRLVLCAILLPVVISLLHEFVLMFRVGSPKGLLIGVLVPKMIYTGLILVFGKFVAMVLLPTPLSFLASFYLFVVNWTFGFLGDLFLTPRIWLARLREASKCSHVDADKRPTDTLSVGVAATELVVVCLAILVSFNVWYYIYGNLREDLKPEAGQGVESQVAERVLTSAHTLPQSQLPPLACLSPGGVRRGVA